jgi:hypothetical protein
MCKAFDIINRICIDSDLACAEFKDFVARSNEERSDWLDDASL